MDVEEATIALGETMVWVECDVCGRADGGSGVKNRLSRQNRATFAWTVCVRSKAVKKRIRRKLMANPAGRGPRQSVRAARG